ncbi:hypothetical protein BBFL7_01019 [Flavobacteria bacterium BBFL7]|nr:hypothetical protein BBFL7_01019 [Flavobacteria bacterium BBFL7]
MKYDTLILEKKEYVYLKRILNISGYAEDFETQKSLQRLTDELKNAQILDELDMPQDVIRFNSKITVKSNKGWSKKIQIVIPALKDLDLDRISILTPLASALLGYAQSDIIQWNLPSGLQELEIVEVTQDQFLEKIEVHI